MGDGRAAVVVALACVLSGPASCSDDLGITGYTDGSDAIEAVPDPRPEPGYDVPDVHDAFDAADMDVVDMPPDSGTDPGIDCTESPCGLLPNCGCPPGEKCYVNTASTPFRRECTTAGTGDPSTICTSEAGCRPATQCLPLYTTAMSGESMCYGYCNSEEDCPTDASVCFSFFIGEIYPKVCSHGCDPIASSGCPSGTKCMIFRLTSPSVELTDCSADSGSTPAGGPCVTEADCAPGTFCGSDTCLAYCTRPSGPECRFSETCQEITDPSTGLPTPVILDGISYGFCE